MIAVYCSHRHLHLQALDGCEASEVVTNSCEGGLWTWYDLVRGAHGKRLDRTGPLRRSA